MATLSYFFTSTNSLYCLKDKIQRCEDVKTNENGFLGYLETILYNKNERKNKKCIFLQAHFKTVQITEKLIKNILRKFDILHFHKKSSRARTQI